MAETATRASETERHEPDEVLSINEACRFLKISRATMYRMINSGEIKGRKVGAGEQGQGRWRFTKRYLLEWVEGQR